MQSHLRMFEIQNSIVADSTNAQEYVPFSNSPRVVTVFRNEVRSTAGKEENLKSWGV